jgi:hypothetical protein
MKVKALSFTFYETKFQINYLSNTNTKKFEHLKKNQKNT